MTATADPAPVRARTGTVLAVLVVVTAAAFAGSLLVGPAGIGPWQAIETAPQQAQVRRVARAAE